MSVKLVTIPDEVVERKIYVVRGQKVMLDRDLSTLYGVDTRRLKEQVRRNIERFPPDFMFEMTDAELEEWRSQFATSNKEVMGLRIRPFVFTEHGVLMLSSVLNSKVAAAVNIQIIRVFTRMRELLLTHKDLLLELEKLRNTSKTHAGKIAVIFKYLKQMEQRQQETELLEEIRRKPRPVVGFKRGKPDAPGTGKKRK
ncbi:MAG: ORF6N domain-containing protein, partial [Flavobacteriales bacterium]